MSIGMHTLALAQALVIEKRLEADLPRRWRTTTGAGISARGTPERQRGSLNGGLAQRQPRRA